MLAQEPVAMLNRYQQRSRQIVKRVKRTRQRHQRTVTELGCSYAVGDISDAITNRLDRSERYRPFLQLGSKSWIKDTARYLAAERREVRFATGSIEQFDRYLAKRK